MRVSKYPGVSLSWLWVGLLCVVFGAGEGRAASAPAPGPFVGNVFVQGNDWVGMTVRGNALDDNGEYLEQDVLVVRNQTGISDAPLPKGVKYDLAADVNGDTVFLLSSDIVNEIFLSEQQGSLTPALQAIAEPADPTPKGFTTSKFFGRCSTRPYDKVKTFNLNVPLSHSTDPRSGFTGTVSMSGNVQGAATGEVHLSLKRYALFGVCVPYGAIFHSAHAYGLATVNYGTTIDGTISYSNAWEKEVADPFLFSVDFAIGPVPVHIGFSLPITIGLDIEASVTGSVSYNGAQNAVGSFDYTCTFNGCTGTANYNQSNSPNSQPFTGSVSGRIKPSFWAQAGFRAYLYTEWVAYAQVGVRPYLRGDLWGYYGNNCGDADQDGVYETVRALTFDLDWQLYITAQAAAFGGPPKKWDDLWHTNALHIRFWDLIGSDALQPMLLGPSTVTAGVDEQFGAKMRPCWPYTDRVNYLFDWGDGTSAIFDQVPYIWQGFLRSWPQPGVVGIGLTARRDEHGRIFNTSMPRTITVLAPSGGGGGGGGGSTGGTWTPWLNRDSPSGTGDWEDLADFVNAGQVCANPIAIECRTTAGIDWSSAGEVYSCSLTTPIPGGVCENGSQPDGDCLDYEVRFLCP